METTNLKEILNVANKQNLVIIGHMGSGKSIFGKKLANNFNVDHIDSDKEIIKFEKSSINDIFLIKGEDYFRKIETKIVLEILNRKNVIISLGGGSVLNKKIRNKLEKKSCTIFLDVDLSVLNNRLKKSKKRPLLKCTNILSKIQQLDLERRKYYLKADLIIDNSYSIDIIFDKFKKYFFH